jgi:hypothetical protein
VTNEEELRLVRESERGARANALLASDIYREAVGKVEAGILERWKAAPIRDREGQHELRLMLKALQDVCGYLNEVAETGRLAGITLEHERGLKARAKNALRELRR